LESVLKKLFLQVPLVLLIASTLFIAAPALSADTSADTFHAVATGAVTYGGDDWQVATSSNGDPVLIHGGGRFEAGVGGAWMSGNYPVMASLVANYHFDTRAGSNASGKFTRVPLDAMVYYTGMEKLRFGVGLSYILSPTVKATVDGNEQSIKFKNALGKSFEIGYEVAPKVWTNLRLSSEKYKPKTNGPAQEASVSHLAVNVSYLF
jgi:outer membrane protein W